MKKWLIALCCVLVAAAIAIVTILNNSNSRIDTLNQDLGNIQAEYNTLKEKNEKDEQTIQDLNHQVTELTTEKDRLTAENEALQSRIYKLEGKPIYQYATTNENEVRLRERPDTGSYRIRELRRGTRVLVIREVVNSKYETWAAVEVDGQSGYIMMKYLDLPEDEEY